MKAKIKLNEYKYNSIKISGSKNSSLPIIAASILCNEPLIIKNVPDITDVTTLITILKEMNYNINFKNNVVTVKPSDIKQSFFNNKKISKLRGSYYIIGALIGKYNSSNFSFLYPGGCKLGKRPIDFHLKAFRDMGLIVYNKKNKIIIKGTKKESTHNLSFPSVGTTINIILASVKTSKTTIINNASIEPEVIDLINFLNSMKANIVINDRTITITGTPYLYSTSYTVMADRIEASTFLCLGALHNGIKITNIKPDTLQDITSFLNSLGYKIKINKSSIILKPTNNIKPFNISLEPYPGFPTDLGPIFSVLATKSYGVSYIKEKVFKERNSHIFELQKINVDIIQDKGAIIINGSNKKIYHSKVKAHDLRCGAALILACSLSKQYSIIKNIENVFRGYENISSKLNSLGIDLIIQ